jgi:hypothetical protein
MLLGVFHYWLCRRDGRMRKFVAFIAGVAVLIGFLSPVTFAATDLFNEVCNGSANNSAVCQDRQDNQTAGNNAFFGNNDSLLIKVANLLSLIVGIAAVIMIIVGGIKYILSSGDSSNVNSAKNMIIFAIVGLVVVAVSRSIIGFVVSKL